MFWKLLRFEVKNRLFRWSSAIYFGLFFFVAFMISLLIAGAFFGAGMSLGGSNKIALNSPYSLHLLIMQFAYFGMLVVGPLFGQSIHKDFESNFHQILFATPIKKSTYFLVRYFGSLISSIAILSSIAFGVWLATLMPFVDRTLIMQNHAWFYLAPYLTGVIPGLLIFGAFILAVISFAKKMGAVYIAGIALFMGGMIAGTLTRDLDNKFLAALIDPYGSEAATQITRYWSMAEQSSQVLPFTGVYLYNRLLWLALCLVALALAYGKFNPFRAPSEKKVEAKLAPASKLETLQLPSVKLQPHSFRVFFRLAFTEFKEAFSNIYFLMILLFGVVFIFVLSRETGKIFGTETLPVTYSVLEGVSGSFAAFFRFLVIFNAGELLWKDRDRRMQEIVDSKPISNLYFYLSKLFSLILLQVFLSFVVLACCVIIQASKGYFHFEWSIYFKSLFFYGFFPPLLLGIFALFIHTLVSQKFVGHAVVIAIYVGRGFLPAWGFDHPLYQLGSIPGPFYSDMNGYGNLFIQFAVALGYWGCFYFLFALLTVLFWKRGSDQPLKLRWQEGLRTIRFPHKLAFSLAACGFLLMGGFIFYNTNILQLYETSKQQEQNSVTYEKRYKIFQNAPTPEIIKAQVAVDLFPGKKGLDVSGTYTYKNKTQEPIKQILLNVDFTFVEKKMEWSKPSKVVLQDKRFGTRVFEFVDPIKPGEEITLSFSISDHPKGIVAGFTPVVGNGSFFNQSAYAPGIGYAAGWELSDEKDRRKYGLPERPRMLDVNDKEGLKKTYISSQGSWIQYDAVVSTSADQIAIAPGYLEKEWVVGDRRYFHYRMDRPMANFYAFQSARYAVKKDKWNDVNIEVYYHPQHTKNLERMIKAVKAGMDYYTKNFSPYQFRQFRIVEFPRYSTFAQSFANTVPFSEGIGFIARVKDSDPEEIDYPFYVTAHELAHQWWGHQVIGANVQGSTMLVESLAEYSALMVQEKEYGQKAMRKFLKYELDNYLSGRGSEEKKENPLALNEGQQYIHYNKGSLILYALTDYMGEDAVNKVLREFIQEHAFKDAPFPRAVDLVDKFRQAAPPELKQLVDDFFLKITFYNNRTDSAQFKKAGAKYEVTIEGESKKMQADESGKEAEVEMKEPIDVGVFDKDGNILYLKKHHLAKGKNTIKVMVDGIPAKAGIDPLNKLIDRDSADNQVKATEAK